jgi:hypothetical protein
MQGLAAQQRQRAAATESQQWCQKQRPQGNSPDPAANNASSAPPSRTAGMAGLWI